MKIHKWVVDEAPYSIRKVTADPYGYDYEVLTRTGHNSGGRLYTLRDATHIMEARNEHAALAGMVMGTKAEGL